jgi:hypothetical protein
MMHMPFFTTSFCLALLAQIGPSVGAAGDLGASIAQQGTPKGVAPCMTCHGA